MTIVRPLPDEDRQPAPTPEDDFLLLLDQAKFVFPDTWRAAISELKRRLTSNEMDGGVYWDESRCVGCMIGTLCYGAGHTDDKNGEVSEELGLSLETSMRPIEYYGHNFGRQVGSEEDDKARRSVLAWLSEWMIDQESSAEAIWEDAREGRS